MFRYGGPIKEGVMHGMQDGGRIGFQDGTKKKRYNWFETPLGSAFDPKQITLGGKKIFAGAYDLAGVPLNALSRMVTGYNPGFSGAKFTGIKPDKKDTAYWMGIPTSTKEGWEIESMKEGPSAAEIELAKLKKQIADQKKGGMPENLGTKAWIDPSKAEALAKTQQNERLQKYLNMMGYDSAKKGAMSKALIDASALVQDATTEAGSLKQADWGKLINRAIQTTSKRLEKPEQIREAVGLMATKAAIEKDLTAETDALKTKALKLNIKKAEKDLKGTSFFDEVSIAQKSGAGGQTATDRGARNVSADEGIKWRGNIISTEDFKDTFAENKEATGFDDVTIVENWVGKKIDQGLTVNDGNYTVGDYLETIKDNAVVNVR